MQRPKINKLYFFVRVVDNRIEHVEFIRHHDGTAIYHDDSASHVTDGPSVEWKLVTSWLEKNGYIESSDAKSKGLIPENWKPEKVILSH